MQVVSRKLGCPGTWHPVIDFRHSLKDLLLILPNGLDSRGKPRPAISAYVALSLPITCYKFHDGVDFKFY